MISLTSPIKWKINTETLINWKTYCSVLICKFTEKTFAPVEIIITIILEVHHKTYALLVSGRVRCFSILWRRNVWQDISHHRVVITSADLMTAQHCRSTSDHSVQNCHVGYVHSANSLTTHNTLCQHINRSWPWTVLTHSGQEKIEKIDLGVWHTISSMPNAVKRIWYRWRMW